jgi:hypothetical protein
MYFVYAIFISGIGPNAGMYMVNGMRWEVPSGNQIADLSKFACEEIIKMARESCVHARTLLRAEAVISVDGSWEHRRNAKRCFVPVCYQQEHKVIDYIIVGNKVPESDPTYCYFPQNMEVHALKLMIDDLKQYPQITAYVHDNDAKARKLFREQWPELREYVDTGHAMKSFERIFLKFLKVLKPVKESLQAFMRILLRTSDLSIEEKLDAWRNVPNHFRGDHERCIYQHGTTAVWEDINDKNVYDCLKTFLDKTEWILQKCTNEWSTQFNESLNRTKSKYGNKNVKWGCSYEARMACAVLDRNSPFWKLELHRRLNLTPMDPCAILQMIARENQRLVHKAHHSMENGKSELKTKFMRRIRSTRQKKEAAPLRQSQYKVNPWLNKWSNTFAPGFDPTLWRESE